jgi:hypothetical protein
MIATFLTRIVSAKILASAFLFVVVGSLPYQTATAESWTDLRGTRTINARMIGLWGESVLLELGNGRRVSVKLDSLRSDSRIQARRLEKRLAAQRAVRIEELHQATLAAAASAPEPLPKPDKAPVYQPPSKDADIDVFLKQIDQAIMAGHLRSVYDALPPSYRTDVDELVRLAAAKMDADGFDSIIDCLQSAGSVLVTHQNWLLNSPRIQAIPESTVSQIRGPLLSLAGLAHATKDSDLFALDKIRSVPFSQWLDEFDRATCDHLHHANQAMGESIKREIEIGSTRQSPTRSNSARSRSARSSSNPPSSNQEPKETIITQVKIKSNDRESSVSLTKVDGYWVPTSIDQENWVTFVNEWKDKIDQSDGDQLIQPYVGYAEGLKLLLRALSSSDNANDFHAAIETTTEFLTKNLPEMAALFGAKLNFDPENRQNSMYYDGMDYEVQGY